MSVISRTDRGLLADWWWTVDRWLLTTILLLMGYGVLLCLAASPPVAQRLNLGEFHFFTRQLVYMILAFGMLVAASFLTVSQVRRVSFVVAVLGFGLLVSTLFIGPVIKGATRWIDVGPVSVQPSEILKPVFVVLAAWLFAESMKRPDMPGTALSALLFVGFAGILILQPDYGQTVLITAVWGLMLFLTGISWRWIGGLMGCGMVGMGIAYSLVPHVADRINRFIDRDSGDTFQVDAALSSFAKGGLLGQGPGEGTVKRILPDAHSDFIFAVAGEELGMVACVLLLGFYAFIVLRTLRHTLIQRDPFVRLATIGLVALIGFQAIINMSVNLSLLPAKGMTLPFVSYGGSSLVSVALAMGLVLALTRRRPAATTYMPDWGGQPAAASV